MAEEHQCKGTCGGACKCGGHGHDKPQPAAKPKLPARTKHCLLRTLKGGCTQLPKRCWRQKLTGHCAKQPTKSVPSRQIQ